jgi:hypothetical protein
MKAKLINSFWGTVFITVSGLLLADTLGYVSFGAITGQGRAMLFGAAGAAFLLTYFLSGVKQWGWLFPALICAALSWSSARASRALDLFNLDWPMLLALAIPLGVGFAVDRKRWGLLIPAYILTFVAVNALIDDYARVALRAGPAGLPLFALASGAGQMFLFALPCFVAYFWSKNNWWALIPAGGLAGLGLANVVQVLIPGEDNALLGVYSAAALLVWAATFGVLWLRRATHSTSWAKYPAIVLLTLAAGAFVLGSRWADFSQEVRAIAFVAGSAAFFGVYFWQGVKKWGWLVPACACAAIALMIWMTARGVENAIALAPLAAGAALPFFVGYAMNRGRRGLLIPAALLSLATIFLLVVDSGAGQWADVMTLFLFALPFFGVFIWSKHHWWALIPAGVFASLGASVLVETLVPHQDYPALPNALSFDVYIWVLFLGLAATFGAVWLRRQTEPTNWAKYPALGLLGVAVLAVLLRERFQEFWLAIVALMVGVMLLLAAIVENRPAAAQPLPKFKT